LASPSGHDKGPGHWVGQNGGAGKGYYYSKEGFFSTAVGAVEIGKNDSSVLVKTVGRFPRVAWCPKSTHKLAVRENTHSTVPSCPKTVRRRSTRRLVSEIDTHSGGMGNGPTSTAPS